MSRGGTPLTAPIAPGVTAESDRHRTPGGSGPGDLDAEHGLQAGDELVQVALGRSLARPQRRFVQQHAGQVSQGGLGAGGLVVVDCAGPGPGDLLLLTSPMPSTRWRS